MEGASQLALGCPVWGNLVCWKHRGLCSWPAWSSICFLLRMTLKPGVFRASLSRVILIQASEVERNMFRAAFCCIWGQTEESLWPMTTEFQRGPGLSCPQGLAPCWWGGQKTMSSWIVLRPTASSGILVTLPRLTSLMMGPQCLACAGTSEYLFVELLEIH